MTKSMTDVTAKSAVSLVSLVEQFGHDEEGCRTYLERLRWGADGPACPKCGGTKISRLRKRHQLDCNSCRHRFSVTTGTVFHDSHLPLWKWFLATYLMTDAKKGVSANQLRRELGVSYKTAWYLCHRIRSAMDEVTPEMLSGIVEADETYVGGYRRGKGRHYMGNKTMVLGAIERGGNVRLRVERRPGSAQVLQGFVREAVADGAEAIYTDQNPSYKGLADEDTRHETVDHSAEEWVRGDVSTQGIESAWSLLKRSIVGSYHQLSAKHLQAYADEFAFRFNNRENPFLFRDTVLRLIEGEILPFKELVHATPSAT